MITKWSPAVVHTGKDPRRILLSHLINAFSKGLQIKCKHGCFHHWAAVEDVTAVKNMKKIRRIKWCSLKSFYANSIRRMKK